MARIYSGLLPAVGYEAGEVQLVKHAALHDHGREDGLAGLISLSGVKFPEARHVAEKAVDVVFGQLGKTPLHGGQSAGYEACLTQAVQRRPQGVDADLLRHLVSQYGAAYQEVVRYGEADPAAWYPLSAASRVTAAEVRHAVREEMAQTLADVVFRRTALDLTAGLEEVALRCCAGIMAAELGWHVGRTRREIDEVRAICSASAVQV